jgi:AcrR family transcriptional regulator
MKSQSPREKYRQELRAAILEAARQAFLAEGYESVSMRSLAERVGCSHGNLYLHFKSKEEIFDCLVEQSFDELAEALRGLKDSWKAGDSIELLKTAALAYVDFGLRNPGAYEFAFVLRRPGAPRVRKPHVAYELLRSLVQQCVKELGLRPGDVDAAGQAVWAAVHGVTSLIIFNPTFPWAGREEVTRRVIDSAIHGLVRPSPAKRRARKKAVDR